MILLNIGLLLAISTGAFYRAGAEKCPRPSPKVTIHTISSTSLTVRWTRLEQENVTGYFLEFAASDSCKVATSFKNRSVVGDGSTNYTIGPLKAWTCYSVRLGFLVANTSCFGEVTVTRTLEDVPIGKPRDLTARSLSSNTIYLEWSNLDQESRNGLILDYVVMTSSAFRNFSRTSKVNDTRLNVTGLLPYTNYTFQVQARNSAGRGPGAFTFNTTFESAPSGQPTSLIASVISSTEIYLQWEEPDPQLQNGVITNYTIDTAAIGGSVNETATTNVPYYNATGLAPFTNYSFLVRAMNSAGFGPYRSVYGHTEEATPGAPGESRVVLALSRKVTIEWSPPKKPNGIILNYRVFYKRSAEWQSKVFNASQTTGNISNLVPFENYTFKVQAATGKGWGENSTENQFQTAESAPSRPPGNITGRNLSSTAVEISWDPPVMKARNGILRFYKLLYKEVSCSVKWENITGVQTPRPFTTAPSPSPTESTREPAFSKEMSMEQKQTTSQSLSMLGNWTVVTINASRTYFQIYNLTAPWVCVEVRVAAITVADGPFSNILHVRSDEDVPEAPREVRGYNLTSRSLNIKWLPPVNPNGHILAYKMFYKSLMATDFLELIIAGDKESTNITGLAPYTLYDVKLQASTRIGFGASSTILRIITDEDVPGPPSDLKVSNLSANALHLNWSRPIQTNGILRGYQLRYERLTKSSESSSGIQEVKMLPSVTSRVLSGLDAFSDYRIRLSAETSKGYGKELVVVVKTDQAVPSPPEGFVVQGKSAFHVFLVWNKVSDKNGTITGYKLQVCNSDKNTALVCPAKVDLSAVSTSYNFTTAAPYTEYRFSLSAVTVKGEGNSSSVSTRTDEYIPSPVRNISILSVSPTSLSVTWLPPSHPNGIVFYRVLYRRAWEGESNNNQTEVTSKLKATVNNLEEYREYIITIRAFTKTGGEALGKEVKGITAQAAPSGPPLSLKATPVSSTAADLSWDHPEELKRNGLILDYEISYNESGVGKILKQGSNRTTYKLIQLKKYATYDIYVVAVNAEGKGPPAKVSFKTLQDFPGPASFQQCTNRSKDSIMITWNPPSEPNGEITGYNLTWRYMENLTTTTELESFKILPAAETTAEILNLEIFSRYLFTIAARTSIGWGPSITTECRTGESVPLEPEKLTVEDSTATSMNVKWEKPKRENGYLLGYKIVWGVVNKETTKPRETKEAVIGNKQSYIISGLEPFSLYSIEISARTSIGYGKSSIIQHKTNESIPSPVRNVRYEVNKTTVFFTWEKPAVEHGFVKYRIYYRMATTPLKSFILDGETSLQRYLVSNLEEYVDYQFKLVPFTGAGEGSSRQYNATTLASAPSGPPLNFTARPLTSRSVQLNWKPPSFFEQNGLITYYRVQITKPVIKERNISKLFLEWDQLEEYQAYTFTVRAVNSMGSSPPTTESATTFQDKPGKPRLQGYENISSTAMRIMWKPPVPEELNGIITQYRLKMSVEPFTEVLRSPIYNATRHSTVIESLEKYTLYQVSLEAATIKGWGPADIVKYHTKEDKPDGPPIGVIVKATTSTSVTLEWNPPKRPNGVIRKYLVRFYKLADIKDKETRSFEMTLGKVIELKPFEDYGFEIACESSGGVGPYSKLVTAKTNIDRPPPPTGTVPQPTVSPTFNGFAIRLWKGSDSNGPIKYYVVVVLELKYGRNGHPLAPSRSPNDYTWSELVTYAKYKELKKSTGDIHPYITAFIKRNDFPKDGLFKVGNGLVYSEATAKRKRRAIQTYYNGELDPSSEYMVFERAFVTSDLFISGPWVGPFATSARPTLPPSSSGGAIAGAIVGVFIVTFIILVAVYYIRRKGYFKKEKPPVVEGEELSLTTPAGRDNTAFDGDYRPRAGAVKVDQFSSHHQNLNKDGKFLFSEEFKLIRNGEECTYEHSHHPINREKNRYTNIVAYDHTRVTLSPFDDAPESDYINANFIDGYSGKREYIATQGPLEHTTEDFWRMVWEQNTTIIVMLTRLEENGKIKCFQYWPEAGSTRFGCMQITTVESSELPDYCIRTFSVINNIFPSQEKFVKQFHFLAWPDHGVPSSQAILSFLRRVRAVTVSHAGPTVVHCSAGVGRTGTYIILDANLQRIADDSSIEIFHFLQHIRKQRNLMVQTESQYVFIHDALMEYLNCGSTEIAAKDLRDYVKKLQRPLSNSDELGVDKEFTKLNSYDRTIQKSFSAANMMSNKTKNRFLNILPFDDTRVSLTMVPGVQGSDYINASFVDGYTDQRQFIATQAPLPSTIPDFWRMIWEQRCTTIVCLVKENDNTKMVKVHRYWPLLESAMHGYFIIEQVSEKKLTDLIVRDLKITHTQEGHSRVVRHFHFVGWPDNSMPENGASLIELIGQVQRWQEKSGNHAVAVHCSTGVGRSGVFIAVFNMIQRVRSEGTVDVFQTVRKLRTMRPAMVQTKAQYLFCYIVLQDYLASFDVHGSFM